MTARPISGVAPRPAADGTAGRIPRFVLIGVVNTGFGCAVLLHWLLGTGLGPSVAPALAMVPTVVLSYVLVSLALGAPRRRRGDW